MHEDSKMRRSSYKYPLEVVMLTCIDNFLHVVKAELEK